MWELQTPAEGSTASPRNGLLCNKVATPAFTIPTRRGLPVHLHPDVLSEMMDNAVWQMPIQHTIAVPKDVRTFYNLGDNVITYMPFRTCNGDVHGAQGDAIQIDGVGGRQKITDASFREIVERSKCDIISAMSEEVDCSAGKNKIRRAHGRALKHVGSLLDSGIRAHILAPVQGGNDLRTRVTAAQDCAKLDVHGFNLGGFGYEESLEDRNKLLRCTIDELPRSKPRFLPLKNGSPLEVLDAISLGIDMVELEFPFALASEGKALVFPMEPAEGSLFLDLRIDTFTEQFSPIEKGSVTEPYTCAYIHHLLQCQELLGYMLLSRHNLSKYLAFFSHIRDHIAKGTFSKYHADWKALIAKDASLENCTAKRAATAPLDKNPKRQRHG
eukprot:GEMP01058099.1.p1 GENE.GEMP01058099.1~~GEMP01058099.1.p1  ORF type:complete len:395 (+),score=77.56 GEMP01058099.1:31-1185(+)